MSEIVIEATPEERKAPKPVPVTLVGVDYQITPPKAGMAIAAARFRNSTEEKDLAKMTDSFFDWIEQAFGKQTDAVFARLEDPNDPLDLPHLQKLQQALMERGAAPNPTTSSSGSQPSRRTGGRTSKATQ